MAVAKVLRNLSHDNVAYHQGDTVEADLDTLKALEIAGVVENVIDAIDGEVVEDKPAGEAENAADVKGDTVEAEQPVAKKGKK